MAVGWRAVAQSWVAAFVADVEGGSSEQVDRPCVVGHCRCKPDGRGTVVVAKDREIAAMVR